MRPGRSGVAGISRASLLFALALFALLAPGAAWASEPPLVERSDDDLLLLELRLGRLLLHDALLAYLARDRLLLPLGETARALDLAIEVDPGAGVAEGWFLRESRRFTLDLARGEVVVEGRRLALPPGAAERHADDVYVDAAALATWLPIDFEPDLRRSRVVVVPREKLPIEERLERERRRARLSSAVEFANGDATLGPLEPSPWRVVDWPAIEHRVAVSARRGPNGEESTIAQSNLLAAGDFLWASAELSVADTSSFGGGSSAQSADPGIESGPDVFLKLGRVDRDGGLLGPLGATSFAVGDLPTPGRALVSREDYARGIEISSFPLDRPETFESTVVRGDALPGWEAELYRNGELFAAERIDEDGRYEFTDVPLEVGLNLLRTMLYGPRGQQREHVERVLIGPESIPAGTTHYRVAVHEHGRRLLVDAPEGFSDEIDPETDPRILDRGEARIFAEVEHGLRRGLGVGARVESLPIEGERRSFLGVGAVASHRGFLGQLDVVADDAGGRAGRLFVEGHLDRVVVRATHRHFDALRSEIAEGDDPLTSSSTLRVELRGTTLGDENAPAWPITFGLVADAETRRSGAARQSVGLRISTTARGVAASHDLEHVATESPQITTEDRLRSRLAASVRRGAWRFRAQIAQSWRPEVALDTLDVSAEHRAGRAGRVRAGLRLGRDGLGGTDGRPLGVDLGFTGRVGAFDLGIDLGFEDRPGVDTWRVGVNVSYALAFEPFARRFRARPRSRAGAARGAVAARVFLDRDLDGRFDPEDEPLSNVAVRSDRGLPGRTDERGVAWVGGLEPGRAVAVGPDIATLEDPYWQPSRESVAILPRAGRVAAIDFPIVPTGEIDGTIYREVAPGEREAVGGVRLRLVDPKGRVVAETTSAYDGFYLFARVLPGRYRLRLDPEQRERLGLAPLEGDLLVIGAEGTVLSGVDRVVF